MDNKLGFLETLPDYYLGLLEFSLGYNLGLLEKLLLKKLLVFINLTPKTK